MTAIGSTLNVVAMGDLMFDMTVRSPRIFHFQPSFATTVRHYRPSFLVPFINDDRSHKWLQKHGHSVEVVMASSHRSQSILSEIKYTPYDLLRHLAPLFRSGDLAVGNLECPLSRRGRPNSNDTCYRASPAAAQALAKAGISVVSFSNNHCFDFGEAAFLDTLASLRRANIQTIGAVVPGHSGACIVRRKGVKVGFLAYNAVGPEVAYAAANDVGVLPLNEVIFNRDIRSLRSRVSTVIVSVHWGIESSPVPLPQLGEWAHLMIDRGADVIIGHHSHMPGGIEIYRHKPIFYSLGNCIFGHSHAAWGDNIIAKLTLRGRRATVIELIPIGTDNHSELPAKRLCGSRATQVLKRVREISQQYGSSIIIENDTGLVKGLS